MDEFIHFFGQSTIRETLVTLVYIIIITIILPSLKYTARTSRIFSVILIWLYGKKLVDHDVFKSISMIHSVNLPARISSIGKKVLFSDILRVETELIGKRLREYFFEKTYYRKSRLERLWSLLGNYKYYERINISIEITSIIDECKVMIPSMLIIEIYPHLQVKRTEIDRYIKKNMETLDVDEYQGETIRELIQISKARLIVAKYEEMMMVYRNQLSANMLTQFISNKNLYELLLDVLNNSILPIFLNIRDTIDVKINELNGEFDGCVYKNHPL